MVRIGFNPLTRLAPAGESAGGKPPSPPRGRGTGIPSWVAYSPRIEGTGRNLSGPGRAGAGVAEPQGKGRMQYSYHILARNLRNHNIGYGSPNYLRFRVRCPLTPTLPAPIIINNGGASTVPHRSEFANCAIREWSAV